MKKQFKLLLASIGLLIILFLLVLLVVFRKDDVKTIKKIIEEKQDINIYLYNSNKDKCPSCSETLIKIKYFTKAYKIDLLKVDIGKMSEKNKKELMQLLLLDEQADTQSNVIYIRKGSIVSTLVGDIGNDSLAESLYQNKLIKEEDYKKEIISEDVDIDKIFQEDINTMVLIGITSTKINETREAILKNIDTKKVNFIFIEEGFAKNKKVIKKISQLLKEKYKTPIVVYIENGKIKDFEYQMDQESIQQFINKNK